MVFYATESKRQIIYGGNLRYLVLKKFKDETSISLSKLQSGQNSLMDITQKENTEFFIKALDNRDLNVLSKITEM